MGRGSQLAGGDQQGPARAEIPVASPAGAGGSEVVIAPGPSGQRLAQVSVLRHGFTTRPVGIGAGLAFLKVRVSLYTLQM